MPDGPLTRIVALLLIALAACTGANFAAAQQVPRVEVPNLWDPQQRFIKPNVKGLLRLRFLTTTDFPPFSFIDRDKRLVGFHVDLARAICEELNVLPVCQIQALPFEELEQAVLGGRGDLIMAGVAVTAENRRKLAFSRPYFKLPARFLVRRETQLSEPLALSLESKPVAIIDGTAHAAFAKATFGDMRLRLFETRTRALRALREGKVDAFFDDGLSLSRWMQSELVREQQKDGAKPGVEPALCCRFAGGPYYSTTYFGQGLSIAMAPGNAELENAINYALRSISDKGKFAEIYLRYFPIGLF